MYRQVLAMRGSLVAPESVWETKDLEVNHFILIARHFQGLDAEQVLYVII